MNSSWYSVDITRRMNLLVWWLLFCWILVRAFVCWGRVFVGNKPRQWTGCTNSPPTYIMHSSPNTFCGFHPSYSNSNKFRPAMACNSCLPHHRRFRMRSEYSVRIGMGMTHTSSWNPTLVLQHDNDDDDESLLLLWWLCWVVLERHVKQGWRGARLLLLLARWWWCPGWWCRGTTVGTTATFRHYRFFVMNSKSSQQSGTNFLSGGLLWRLWWMRVVMTGSHECIGDAMMLLLLLLCIECCNGSVRKRKRAPFWESIPQSDSNYISLVVQVPLIADYKRGQAFWWCVCWRGVNKIAERSTCMIWAHVRTVFKTQLLFSIL